MAGSKSGGSIVGLIMQCFKWVCIIAVVWAALSIFDYDPFKLVGYILTKFMEFISYLSEKLLSFEWFIKIFKN